MGIRKACGLIEFLLPRKHKAVKCVFLTTRQTTKDSKMIRRVFFTTSFILLSHGAQSDNLVYIDQTGSTATIAITQDGSANSVGSSTTNSLSIGSLTNIDIDQIGVGNSLNYAIYGDEANVDVNISGSSSTVALSLGKTGVGSSDEVTVTLNVTNNDNDIGVSVGSIATGVDDVNIDILIVGDLNKLTIKEDSTFVSLGSDKLTNINIIGDSNIFDITKSGALQHDTTISQTGSDSEFTLSQVGAVASTVDIASVGSSSTFTINISD
jgi:hypothetical protein